jgi:hypothetical protein
MRDPHTDGFDAGKVAVRLCEVIDADAVVKEDFSWKN